MIIDSHAHYAHERFTGSFRYLSYSDGEHILEIGTLDDVWNTLDRMGISGIIEPGISLQSNKAILKLYEKYPEKVFPAVGVHPTRTIKEKWKNRKELNSLVSIPGIIAIGETGLDYHYKREDQHRMRQLCWFLYQLNLARKNKLPIILHVRNAHSHAIAILRLYRGKKNGGVIHCFRGDWKTAEKYLKLGYHIGIGCSILQKEDRVKELWEAVRRIPLERILIETDSPYVLPDCGEMISRKQHSKVRNTSLVLPAVIQKIAELKNVSPDIVERVTTDNAIHLFSLLVEK